MKIHVIKRDGRKELVQLEKIVKAIQGAAQDIQFTLQDTDIDSVMRSIGNEIIKYSSEIEVDKIHDIVEMTLIKDINLSEVGVAYKAYRSERNRMRDMKSDLMRSVSKIYKETGKENANVGNSFSGKLLQSASATNKWCNLHLIPKHLSKPHENFDYHIHDLDSYYLTLNCLHIPTDEVLERGFNPGYGRISPPKRITSAASLSCIVLQSSQNSLFGGQSHENYDNDLAKYVELTRQEITKEYIELGLEGQALIDAVEKKVRKETLQAGQITIYNLNSMHARAGAQVPFSSLNIGLPLSDDAALVCEGILLAFEEGIDGRTPIFPNLIFRVKDGVNKKPGDKYYWLFQLACRVAAKRMNPTFLSLDTPENLEYYNKGILASRMGCRTNVMANVNGREGGKGRGNNFPVTINMPRLALRAKGNREEFFKNLEDMMLLCEEQLMHRYNVCKELKVKDLPFCASEGLMLGSEGLSLDDSIEPIMKHGTMGIGYIGLAETLIVLTGEHHGESEEADKLGVGILEYMKNFTDELKEKYKLNFSVYSAPSEGLSGRFTPQDRKVFGIIPGVTDKEHYTNSNHIPVDCKISIAKKLEIEGKYHKYASAGNILYVELDNYPDAQTIEDITVYAFNNTEAHYIAINFHIRQCKHCGEFVQADACSCHKCGSVEIQGISRITGYLALDERFNPGKIDEKKRRVSHTNGKKAYMFV